MCDVHLSVAVKEVVMHVMGRIGFMGLGIALVGCLGGAPVFAADKPIEDGSKIMITSPKAGDKVSDSFELKYEVTKDEQVRRSTIALCPAIIKATGASFIRGPGARVLHTVSNHS